MSFNAAEAALADAPHYAPGTVTVEDCRQAARHLRDQRLLIEDLEQRLEEARAKYNDMQFREVPDLLMEAGSDSLGLPAEGNLAAYDLKVRPYFKANIAADWEAPRREAAFDWLEGNELGDVVSRDVVVSFRRGPEERAEASRLMEHLRAEGYRSFRAVKQVPWQTLTKVVRELHEEHQARVEEALSSGREPPPAPPYDLLGATVGRRAEIKPRGTSAPRRAGEE